MSTGVYKRYYKCGGSDADGVTTPAINRSFIKLTSGQFEATLVRSRLQIELRVHTYILGSERVALITDWWIQLMPVIGLFWTDTIADPGEAESPINPDSFDEFVMLEAMAGEVELQGLDVNDNATLTYKYFFREGSLNSFARRRPQVGSYGIVYLCWDWNQTVFPINQSHVGNVQAYDLGAHWNLQTWWKPPVT